MRCTCPYVICKFHGDCAACIEHNRMTNDLAHCMEAAAQQRGAKLPLRLPKTYVEADYDAMSKKSAELICEVVNKKPHALISLAAGTTALGTYQHLKKMAENGEVDFSKTHFVALDEWLDLQDESENCNSFMMKNFYGPLQIRETQITRFDIHAPAEHLTEACKAVDEVIFAHGGIDVMLLGVGMNGHLGLNEPNSDFSLYSKVVELDPVTTQVGQKYFSAQTKLTRGITLGVRHMFDTGLVILQAGGKHKADIIEKTYRTAPTEEIPSTVLKLLPHGVIVLDKEAASQISDLF